MLVHEYINAKQKSYRPQYLSCERPYIATVDYTEVGFCISLARMPNKTVMKCKTGNIARYSKTKDWSEMWKSTCIQVEIYHCQ